MMYQRNRKQPLTFSSRKLNASLADSGARTRTTSIIHCTTITVGFFDSSVSKETDVTLGDQKRGKQNGGQTKRRRSFLSSRLSFRTLRTKNVCRMYHFGPSGPKGCRSVMMYATRHLPSMDPCSCRCSPCPLLASLQFRQAAQDHVASFLAIFGREVFLCVALLHRMRVLDWREDECILRLGVRLVRKDYPVDHGLGPFQQIETVLDEPDLPRHEDEAEPPRALSSSGANLPKKTRMSATMMSQSAPQQPRKQ
mmetsp:Transcript_24985/g.59368  ORF Transcript_24985/g.59368 Transcript_24985/m.59368 type:complete len:253 (-) Transcript_24985:1379-2137(-)